MAYSGTAITIQGNTVGGVVGNNYRTVTNCYYDSGIQFLNASGGSATLKEVTGVTAESGLSNSLKSQSGFSSRTGLNEWDFTNIWIFKSGENNNFPVLRVFYSYIVNYIINNNTEETYQKYVLKTEGKVILQSPEELGYTYAGYEFLYWTDIDGNRYNTGEEITVSQDITLTAQWEQAKSTIDFTITNNTGDTVLVVFKYDESIVTFRVVGDISATSGVTKKYSFKVAPQSGCVIYIIGGNYTTNLTGVTPTATGENSYTIDCSSAVTMTLTINN